MPWGKREPGRHERPKNERCGYTWSSERPKMGPPVPGACYDHRCGLLPGHGGSHVCMVKWECGATK